MIVSRTGGCQQAGHLLRIHWHLEGLDGEREKVGERERERERDKEDIMRQTVSSFLLVNFTVLVVGGGAWLIVQIIWYKKMKGLDAWPTIQVGKALERLNLDGH